MWVLRGSSTHRKKTVGAQHPPGTAVWCGHQLAVWWLAGGTWRRAREVSGEKAELGREEAEQGWGLKAGPEWGRALGQNVCEALPGKNKSQHLCFTPDTAFVPTHFETATMPMSTMIKAV